MWYQLQAEANITSRKDPVQSSLMFALWLAGNICALNFDHIEQMSNITTALNNRLNIFLKNPLWGCYRHNIKRGIEPLFFHGVIVISGAFAIYYTCSCCHQLQVLMWSGYQVFVISLQSLWALLLNRIRLDHSEEYSECECLDLWIYSFKVTGYLIATANM